MKTMMRMMVVAGALLLAPMLMAQAPAGAPAGSMGMCKDGTYSTAASKQGACRGHQGVKDWYVAASAKVDAPAAKAAPAAAATMPAKAAPTPAAMMPAKAAPVAAAAGPKPAGATGECKDGTYSTAASKQGACRGHQGVKEWYAAPASAAVAKADATAPVAVKSAPTASAPSAPAASMAAKPAPTAVAPASAKGTAVVTQAAGGGPGMVWVNTGTKVYHCSGSQFYGKTKEGKYMSETDAKTMGARADHNKPCTK
jgi:hypothetical protein